VVKFATLASQKEEFEGVGGFQRREIAFGMSLLKLEIKDCMAEIHTINSCHNQVPIQIQMLGSWIYQHCLHDRTVAIATVYAKCML
jgi:hypothetical protein